MRYKIAPEYSEEFLEVERPQPLTDNKIEKLQLEVISGKISTDITDKVYADFKVEMQDWILSSSLNRLSGLDTFPRVDIINGCTQFIDNLYMQGPVQVIEGDYRYHNRLGLATVSSIGSLKPSVPLIIAMPFPSIGAPHSNIKEILNECVLKDIAVHIDSAWISCCRDVDFDYNHPAIRSVGISLSKGLGLGWNRIGLRWTKETKADSITIMNDFHMNNRALVMIGLHYLRSLPVDYLWTTHSTRYHRVCYDFNLMPTKSIYLALRKGQPVGVSPLIRYLENDNR